MEAKGFIRLRHRLLPKVWTDYPAFLLATIMIPVTYWYEMWVVLPSLLRDNPFSYYFMFTLAHFLLFNIVGNYIGIVIVDTSITGRMLPCETSADSKFCAVCETVTPPRAYHCPDCNICILKRGHHCMFAGCCIGHYNYRFFLMFLLYLFLAVAIALPFNIYFLWDLISQMNLFTILMIVFPIFTIMVDPSLTTDKIYLGVSAVGFLSGIMVFVWSTFHVKMVLKGCVVYEGRREISTYDLGKKRNIQEVFGTRWKVAWLSPFIASPLPSDGLIFATNSDNRPDCNKTQ